VRAQQSRISLWIQIPCFNEEFQLPIVLESIPKHLPGITDIDILVINDGSTDGTLAAAKYAGVLHFVNFTTNRGLSAAFQSGLTYCLNQGADVIVNLDADNQYPTRYIESLIEPILMGRADVVIGDRQPGRVQEFHFAKRFFQRLGSRLTSILCGVPINDATSGFRAYTKEAAEKIHITNPYTYTLESIIQLSFYKFKIENAFVEINKSLRPSRLFKSNSQYIRKNGIVLFKSYIQFSPIKFFGSISLIFAATGLLFYMPFISSLIAGSGSGHLQSLILGTLFFLSSIQFIGFAFIGDAIRALRLTANKRSTQPSIIKDYKAS
jgi:glycosyltransferase involved in cell wall biosynthesis